MTTESDDYGRGPLVLIVPAPSPPVPVSSFPKKEIQHDTPSLQLNMGSTAPLTLQCIKGYPPYNDMWSICAFGTVSVIEG
ncbi:hypothetical protein V490_08551 [Pseudogymnoascus sp. VKM F-3557]|nr:hypothetical protein V490_08551 [Pseudogymnoascus sp. VKM F-3557]